MAIRSRVNGLTAKDGSDPSGHDPGEAEPGTLAVLPQQLVPLRRGVQKDAGQATAPRGGVGGCPCCSLSGQVARLVGGADGWMMGEYLG
jgi:hypothetical protein